MHYLIALISLFIPGLALAADADEMVALKKRVEILEQRNAELYHDLAEKKDAGRSTWISDHLSISGLLEVEAATERQRFKNGNTDSTSDLILATAQLGLGIAVNESIGGDLILLFEEDEEGDDRVVVDEAAVNLGSGAWSGRIGRQYLPFGHFHSHFINDPLTLELGETRETALLAGYDGGSWSLSAFAFNGQADRDGGENHLDDFGLSLSLTPHENMEFGVSYLSDLADSDAQLADDYRKRVGGWSAYAEGVTGPLKLSGEILGADRRFAAADLDADGNGKGDRPLAWNLEAATDLSETVEIALRLEGSRELAETPETQYGAAISWSPYPHVSLSLEYLRGEYDRRFAALDAADSPMQTRDLVSSQLAIEF
ncbi:LbtU family siderophore porin [Trichloromonas sp.]|uniref:LbtU family siderophore porin n=1 Tax=Trichloromonas sp. TaxID=3069249 RepID=UPI003D81AAB3